MDVMEIARRIAGQRGEMAAFLDPRAGWSRKELLGELSRAAEERDALLRRIGELVMQNNELMGRLPLAERMKLLFPSSPDKNSRMENDNGQG